MRLFRIKVRHCAPKDSHTSTEGFLVAESSEAVLDWLVKQDWTYYDDEEHLEEEFDVYDDDEFEIVGTETRRERWVRFGGEIHDDNADFSEAYYGITHYGWEEIAPITEVEMRTLARFGLLFDNESTKGGIKPPVTG